MKKNFIDSNKRKSNFESNSPNKKQPTNKYDTNEQRKYFVYIGNILTDQIKNSDINNLINLFLNSFKYDKNVIKSIKVYKNCLYICFEKENIALEASKFYNNFQFISFKLESIFYNENLSSAPKLDEEEEEADNIEYYHSNFNNQKKYTECEIIVSNRQLKKYADTINDKINKDLFGIKTFIKYLNQSSNEEQMITKETIQDGFKRDLLYLVYINQSNEQFNSINLIIFNKWRLKQSQSKNHTIKENKNMPSNKAFELLKSDYLDYINNLKDTYKSINKVDDIENENESHFKSDNENLINLVLNKLGTSDKALDLKDVDFLITILNKQKLEIISSLKKDQINKNVSEMKPQTDANHLSFNINNQFQSANLQPLLSQTIAGPIPSLMQTFYQPSLVHTPQINFLPSIANINQPPSLMSLINHQHTQAPSLMSLQTSLNGPSLNQNFNLKRY